MASETLPSGKTDKIVAVLALSEDDLCLAIGRFLEENSLGASLSEPEHYILAGKKWFQNKRQIICDCICKDDTVVKLANKSSIEDKEALILLLSDLVLTLASGVPVIYISALISKVGIGQICKDYWTVLK